MMNEQLLSNMTMTRDMLEIPRYYVAMAQGYH